MSAEVRMLEPTARLFGGLRLSQWGRCCAHQRRLPLPPPSQEWEAIGVYRVFAFRAPLPHEPAPVASAPLPPLSTILPPGHTGLRRVMVTPPTFKRVFSSAADVVDVNELQQAEAGTYTGAASSAVGGGPTVPAAGGGHGSGGAAYHDEADDGV